MTNGAIVKQAGWGMNMHYENFGEGIDRASYSTCMTNELGEIPYRFDYCDLRDLVSQLSVIAIEISLSYMILIPKNHIHVNYFSSIIIREKITMSVTKNYQRK